MKTSRLSLNCAAVCPLFFMQHQRHQVGCEGDWYTDNKPVMWKMFFVYSFVKLDHVKFWLYDMTAGNRYNDTIKLNQN